MTTPHNTTSAKPVSRSNDSNRVAGQHAKPADQSSAMAFQRPAPHATAPMVPSEHQVFKFTY